MCILEVTDHENKGWEDKMESNVERCVCCWATSRTGKVGLVGEVEG